MSRAERLAHALWTAEHEDKAAIVDGRHRKAVWGDLVAEIRRLTERAAHADALVATVVQR